ncbi:MAG: hypothetical protein AB7O24_00310 [Kofleriaceae bacterium]
MLRRLLSASLCLGFVFACVPSPEEDDSLGGAGGNGKADEATTTPCTVDEPTCPDGQTCRLDADGMGLCEDAPTAPPCGRPSDAACPESQVCKQTDPMEPGTCIKEVRCGGPDMLPCGEGQTCVLDEPAMAMSLGHCE